MTRHSFLRVSPTPTRTAFVQGIGTVVRLPVGGGYNQANERNKPTKFHCAFLLLSVFSSFTERQEILEAWIRRARLFDDTILPLEGGVWFSVPWILDIGHMILVGRMRKCSRTSILFSESHSSLIIVLPLCQVSSE